MTLNKTKSTIATGSEFLVAQQGFNQNNLHLKMYKKNNKITQINKQINKKK